MAWTDRVVEHPNRFTLTAVSGQDNVYDLEATEGTVYVEGTLLNADNLSGETTSIATGVFDEKFEPSLNELVNDYVIERGTQDGWTYEKWNSGWIRMWGTVQYSSIPCTVSGNGTYYTSSSPSKQSTIPIIQTIKYANGSKTGSISSGMIIYEYWLSGNVVSVNFRSHASISSAQCGVRWYFEGTWK